MRRCTDKEWRELVDAIEPHLPFPRDYEIKYLRKSPGELGDKLGCVSCLDYESAKFEVWCSRNMTAEHTMDVLMHELAHIADWMPYTPYTEDHGGTFWLRLGQIYTRYYQVR